MEDARSMAALAASPLGMASSEVLIASTGVIGKQLDMEKIRRGVQNALLQLSKSGGASAAKAIMTTDLVAKTAARRFRLSEGKVSITLGGMTKGSGMIHPNMATMLAFVTTDASISARCLRKALQEAVSNTFNMITVDGDTSTNDSLIVLANGMAGNRTIADPASKAYREFTEALTDLCRDLAVQIARDGEGATRLVRIEVEQARSEKEARIIAKSIAGSNLVKTAIFGGDPNWGRILCAAGYADAKVDAERANLWLGRYAVVKNGQPRKDYDARKAAKEIQKKEVLIRVSLGLGKGNATAWTCDFSYDYVRINAEYHT